MIKLHSSGIASDYTEHGSVTTDCKTVGQFMTEAAAIFSGNLTIKVDGCRYDLSDNTKIRVADDTPIDEITYACVPGSTTFIVSTRPIPKTVRKSGWVAVIDSENRRQREVFGDIYDTLEAAKYHNNGCGYKVVGFARIEWEEEV